MLSNGDQTLQVLKDIHLDVLEAAHENELRLAVPSSCHVGGGPLLTHLRG